MFHERRIQRSVKKTIHKQLKKDLSLRNLYKNVQEDIAKVEETLTIFVQSPNELISEIGSYLFKKTGKRIRPALLVLCSKMLGYQGKEHILMSALIETIHTASLIHDDIIDNSKLRRGRESVHARWGPNITVLLGDYLYIKAIGLSLKSKYRQIIQILTDISAKMIEGELYEYYVSGKLDLAEKDYLGIINKKTASLFSASCHIGGILGEASKEEKEALIEFGTNLGMSFQIIDDLLDFTGDEKILGKPILSDLNEGRITLPLIYTLNHDGKENRKRMSHLLKESHLGKDTREEMLEIIRFNGALDYTYKKAEEYSDRSKEIISQFPQSIHRDTLTLFSDYLLTRKK